MATQKDLRRIKIKYRIRKKLAGSAERPRFSVFKSNSSIYAQLVDDVTGTTLAHVSSKEVSDAKSANVSVATEVGKKIAEKAAAKGVSSVVFDRNGYLFHGKVKALADAAREGGLKF